MLNRSLLALVFLLAAAPLPAAELAPKPPALYKRTLERLLTPAEVALAMATSVDERARLGGDATVVLAETLLYLREDGSLVRVDHEILRATTDAGAESIARATYPFRQSEQRVHLALARTLQADGTRVAVRPDAAFVQAEEALSTDFAEVVLVFPEVRAGSAVEYVTVTEQAATRIPGELTAFFRLDYLWPADRVRVLVEVPAAMAPRLRTTGVGAVPEARRETLKSGRLRLTWRKDGGAGRKPEPSRAPHRGPGVWLTTLASWEGVADWYRGLLAGRDRLPPELAAQVDRWTDGAASPAEVVRTLHRRVADDVRSTGVELGAEGFRPKPCAQVWRDRSGDGKDKANLLRAFLAYKGIRSYVAFLDTTHAGSIETRSPDYRHFNHAILAVDRGDGRYLWSDPTIPYLPVGFLGPRDTGRDVLVLRDRGYQFTRTPRQSSGTLDVSFDLRLADDGGLSGELAVVADGYRGAAYRDDFGDLAERRAFPNPASYVGRFFAGAEVADFEIAPGDELLGPRFELRARFTVAAGDRPGVGAALRFPHGDLLFARLPADTARETAYYQPLLTTSLRLRYELPEGWTAREPPPPLRVEHDALTARGSWRAGDGEVVAEVLYEQPDNLVEPARFESFAQANESLAAWMERSLLAGPEGVEVARAAPADTTSTDTTSTDPAAVDTAAVDTAAVDELVLARPGGDSFDAALAHWLSAHGPPWLAWARPASLAEVADVEIALDGADDSWSDPERVKIALLLAQDAERPAEQRAAALVNAVRRYKDLQPRYSSARPFLRAVLDDEGFGLVARRDTLFLILLDAFDARQEEIFRSALEHPLVSSLTTAQEKTVERLAEAISVPTSSPPMVSAYLRELVSEPLASLDLAVLRELFNRLLMLGALAEAQEVYDATETMGLVDGGRPAVTETRFQLLRRLRLARRIDPVLTAMRAAAFARVDRAAAEASSELWQDVTDARFLALLNPEEATAARWHQLAVGLVPLETATFWPGELAEATDASEERTDLVLEIALAGIAKAPEDRVRFLLILSAADVVVGDDSERLARLFAATEPYRDPQSDPLSYGALRLVELHQKVRRGEEVDVEVEVAEIQGPRLSLLADMFRISYHLARRDADALRRILSALPADRLIQPLGLEGHLLGLELLGLEEEVALVRKAAEEELYKAVLASWASPSSGEIRRVLGLSKLLHGAPGYPDAWLADVLAVIEDEAFAHRVRLLDAELRGDWTRAAEEAAALVEQRPRNNSLYWNVGLAAYHLGDWDRAREALGRYARTCRDEIDHSRAVELLAEVEAKLGGA